MTRATVVTALAGALVALAVVGGFLALDRTVLHWYVDASSTSIARITRTEAEAYAIDYMYTVSWQESNPLIVKGWVDSGWFPFCDAEAASHTAWLAQCGMKNSENGRELRQLATYLVQDDGTVSQFP